MSFAARRHTIKSDVKITSSVNVTATTRSMPRNKCVLLLKKMNPICNATISYILSVGMAKLLFKEQTISSSSQLPDAEK